MLVVTGTDTGVGKTIVTAGLAAVAEGSGRRVAVVKPVQTGVGPDHAGDLDEVRRLTGVADLHELARLPDPLAPATAARVVGVELPTITEAAAEIEQLGDRDLVLVEGSGGLLVQLDGRGGTVADLAVALGAEVLVVARAGLGTLNHAALTCEALRARGLDCAGIVVGAWPLEPDLTARCNLAELPAYAGAPVIGLMPANAGDLSPAAFLAAARGGLSLAAVRVGQLARTV
jgi:dethiobiotin synthetase